MPQSPQLENGYTSIANELLEQFILIKLTTNEWAILHTVMRKTWGWHKKEDKISLTQFEKMTGLNRSTVNRNIKRLVARMILVATQQPSGNVYQIEKDYSKWVTSCYSDTSCRFATTLVATQQPELVATQQHTKEKKETIQKKVLTSKNSLTACSEEELLTISKDLQISLSNVKDLHEEMMGKVEDGIFQQKKYGKTIYYTLRNWLRKAIKEKHISVIKQEDDYVRRLNEASK